jgi:PPE-repeat protein
MRSTANTEEGTVLDFGALPPEINSGRIYAGPGSEPMMVASAAWDELAAELGTATSGYNSVIDELTNGPWMGPTSASMVAAVAPYVTWLSAAAAQAEETASQARAAAAAFEAVFSMTVPPPVIAANRVLLSTLVATNFLGQNSPAIAATEAQYVEMWAQDAVAMYGYTGSSALASELNRFTSPPNTTTPDGEASQFAAVAQATASPAANAAQTVPATASGLTSAAPATQLFPTFTIWPFSLIQSQWQDFLKFGLPSPLHNYTAFTTGDYTAIIKQTLQAYFGVGVGSFGFQIGQQTFNGIGTTAGASGAWYPTPQFAGLHLGALGVSSNTGGGMSATLASSSKIGGLSVPSSWLSPGGTLEASAAQAVDAQTVGAVRPAGFAAPGGLGGNSVLQGMPMGGAGRRAASTAFTNKYGFKRSVLARPPSAG